MNRPCKDDLQSQDGSCNLLTFILVHKDPYVQKRIFTHFHTPRYLVTLYQKKGSALTPVKKQDLT